MIGDLANLRHRRAPQVVSEAASEAAHAPDAIDLNGALESPTAPTVPHPGPSKATDPDAGEAGLSTVPYRNGDTGPGSAGAHPLSAPNYQLVLRVDDTRYRFVEKVHRSKMSQIWRAVELGSGSNLAVKIVARQSAVTTDRAALAALTECSASPHLVKCLRHCIKGYYWYQLLEWLDGETMTARLRRDSRQTPKRMLERWLRQVGTGLSTLHDAGIVHGDVKPDNIFIVDEQARLIDLCGQRLGVAPRHKVALTPSFACQDAMRGAPADVSDDVYSYALTALCVLTKRIVPPGDGFKPDGARPGAVNETQWKALRVALEPARAERSISIGELATAIWTPPRLVVPAVTESPRTPDAIPTAAPLRARRDRRMLRRFARRMRRTGNYAVISTTGVAMLVFALVTPPRTDTDLGRLVPPVTAMPDATAQEVLAPATPVGVRERESAEARPRRLLSAEALIALAGVTTARAQPGVEEPDPQGFEEAPAAAPSERRTAQETDAERDVASPATEPSPGTEPASVAYATENAEPDSERALMAMSTVNTALGGSGVLSTPRVTAALWTPGAGSLPDRPTLPDGPAIPDIDITPDVPVTPDLPARPVVDRPEVPPSRPEVPAKAPDIREGRPDVPSARPDAPGGRPDAPSARPEFSPGGPNVPQGRPDVPQGRPDVPTGRPDIPGGRPDVPATRPDIPAARPDLPPQRPDVPHGRPDIPRGRPDIPPGRPG